MASVFDMPAGEFLDTPQQRSLEQPKSTKEATAHGPLNPALPIEQAPSNIIYTHSPAAPLLGEGLRNLYKTIGEGATEAVHGVDTFFKGIINKELHDKIDPLRDKTEQEQFGRLLPGQINQPPPETLKNRLQGLQNFKTAAEQGHIPHIYYEMQLNSIAKSARSEHPGYREYIDEQISHITGGNPANKVINELFQANAAAHGTKVDREQKLWDHFYTEGETNIPGFNNWIMSRKNETGQLPTLDEMADKINGTMAKRAQVRADVEDTRKAKDADALAQGQLEETAIRDYHHRYNTSFAKNGPNWADLDGFNKNIASVVTGPDGTAKIDPKQYTLALTQISKLTQDLKDIERQVLTDKLYEGLSAKGVKDIQEVTKAMTSNLTGIFADGDFHPGIAHAVTNTLKAVQDMDRLTVLAGDDAARMLDAIRHIGGDQVANRVIEWNKSLMGDQALESRLQVLVKAKLTSGLGQIFTNQKPMSEVLKDPDYNKVDGAKGALVKSSVQALLDDSTKPEGLANIYKNMYASGDNFLVTKSGDTPIIPDRTERDRLFAMMTSPATIEKGQQLLKDGLIQPEHWEAMKSWAGKYVTNEIASHDADQLKFVNRPENHFNIFLDPSSDKFVVMQNPHVIGNLGQNISDTYQRASNIAQRLNDHLDPLLRVAQAEKTDPKTIAESLRTLFQYPQINYNLDQITLRGPQPEQEPGTKTQGRIEEKKVRQVPIQ